MFGFLSSRQIVGYTRVLKRERARVHAQFDRQPVGQVTSSPLNIIASHLSPWGGRQSCIPAPPCALSEQNSEWAERFCS